MNADNAEVIVWGSDGAVLQHLPTCAFIPLRLSAVICGQILSFHLRPHGDGSRRKSAIRALMKGFAPSSPPPPATCPHTEGIGTSSTRWMSFASARASDTGK